MGAYKIIPRDWLIGGTRKEDALKNKKSMEASNSYTFSLVFFFFFIAFEEKKEYGSSPLHTSKADGTAENKSSFFIFFSWIFIPCSEWEFTWKWKLKELHLTDTHTLSLSLSKSFGLDNALMGEVVRTTKINTPASLLFL